MSRIIGNNKPGGVGIRERLRKRIIPLLTLILVIVITVVLFFYGRKPEIVAELKGFGYLGAFLISLIGNGTVLLPGIVLPILSGLGIVFYQADGLVSPVIVGLAGGAGAAIGEIVGYMAGYAGRGIVENNKLYQRLVGWVRRWGAIAIFIFALVPLFFDLVGLAAGVLRFPLWKFILVCWLGRTILYVVFIVLAALGWEAVLPYFG
ncbi:MAG: VTT domain-containing protein [Dehalococcoidales bacterium]